MRSSDTLLVVHKEPKSYLIKYIHKKIFKDNEDFVLIVTGKRGRGKSYASLRLGESFANEIGIPFNVQDNVKYTVRAMLSSVNSLKFAQGTPIIMEEAGVHANARKFMSEVNAALNFFTQTVRTRHYFIIFNLPKAKMVDFSVRNMASARLEIIAKDPARKVSIGKLYLLDYDEFTKKEWRRNLRIAVRGKMKLSVLKLIEFALPSEQVRIEYEEKKKIYTAKLYDDLEGSISGEFGEIELGDETEDTPTKAGVNVDFVKKVIALRNEYGLNLNQMKEVTGYKNSVIKGVFKFAKDNGMYVRKKKLPQAEFDLYGIDSYKEQWKRLMKVKYEEGEKYETEKPKIKE
jgi:hypothetical protein